MRIISQDSRIDLPYNRIMLCIEGVLVTARNDGKQYLIGKYSTEEKAIKAMEMCREKYLSRMELDGGYDTVNGCYVQPNYWVLPKVFQFPADDEIYRARKI